MRTVRRRWLDVFGLLFTLGAAAVLLYALLPMRTQPNQSIVPPLSGSAADPAQVVVALVVLFGTPVVLLIGAALTARWIMKAEATRTAAVSTSKSAADDVNMALSPREERFWKVVATLLIVGVTGGVVAALWPDLVRLFSR
jgi:hypothetical protein